MAKEFKKILTLSGSKVVSNKNAEVRVDKIIIQLFITSTTDIKYLYM